MCYAWRAPQAADPGSPCRVEGPRTTAGFGTRLMETRLPSGAPTIIITAHHASREAWPSAASPLRALVMSYDMRVIHAAGARRPHELTATRASRLLTISQAIANPVPTTNPSIQLRS